MNLCGRLITSDVVLDDVVLGDVLVLDDVVLDDSKSLLLCAVCWAVLTFPYRAAGAHIRTTTR